MKYTCTASDEEKVKLFDQIFDNLTYDDTCDDDLYVMLFVIEKPGYLTIGSNINIPIKKEN